MENKYIIDIADTTKYGLYGLYELSEIRYRICLMIEEKELLGEDTKELEDKLQKVTEAYFNRKKLLKEKRKWTGEEEKLRCIVLTIVGIIIVVSMVVGGILNQ